MTNKNLSIIAFESVLYGAEPEHRAPAGVLDPYFKRENKYLQIGDNKEFNKSRLNELVNDGCCSLIEEIDITKNIDYESLKYIKQFPIMRPSNYPYNAQVFHFLKTMENSLGKDFKKVVEGKNSIQLKPLQENDNGSQDYTFYFVFDRENIVNRFVPEVNQLCKDKIYNLLHERINPNPQGCLVSGREDIIAQYVETMMNIACDNTLEDSIKYYGNILLLSPHARGFGTWLDFVCTRNKLNETEIREKYFRNNPFENILNS